MSGARLERSKELSRWARRWDLGSSVRDIGWDWVLCARLAVGVGYGFGDDGREWVQAAAMAVVLESSVLFTGGLLIVSLSNAYAAADNRESRR